MRPTAALSLTLILTTLLTLVPLPSRAAFAQGAEEADVEETEKGLSFRLNEGEEKPDRPAPHRVVSTAPLPEAEAARLLARLPPFRPEAGDAQDFKLRESSLPPPRAGQTIRAAFGGPEPGGPPRPAPTDAPLEVLRFAPEGEVGLAPAVSITFSQPVVVRGLLGARRRGRWESTQENVFVLLALERYFQTYEKATPDFVARVWLGDSLAGERRFRGRSADRQELVLPMSALAARTAAAPADLTIGKQGAGRLYYRVGARYAPSNLKLEAADYGFRVERAYEAVDDPRDVSRDAEGVWRIRAGARVRVRVRLLNPARRYHVALVDPLPAGLEALNPALATTERLPEGAEESALFRGGRRVVDYYWLRRGPWYDHQNLRDDRAEAFTSLLWEGEHEYSYFARATTLGLFVVPPAKAEEMYAPETFGRGQTDRVSVE